MLLLKIVLGLFGLGIVVFVHELGHFLGARLCGIGVEAFSLGWGKPLLKKKIGAVEYRLGMFPLGGYCKMKGESDYGQIWENHQKGVTPEPGSFFAARPWRRIVVSFFGPLFNVIFAVIVLSFVWGFGFPVQTLGNKIILASELYPDEHYPADDAGFKTGDRIVKIGSRDISYYHEIQELIATAPEKTLLVTVDRDGAKLGLSVKPSLDKSTATGKIGIISWVEPVLDAVKEGKPAALAGLASGDRINRVNGVQIPHSVAFSKIMEGKPDALFIEYERDGENFQTTLYPLYPEEGPADLGIGWAFTQYRSPALSPFKALAKGVSESWNTMVVSVKSLKLLFKGIDLTKAVSGPIRITYMMGDIATEGFGQSVATGLRSMANFLALISIALCVMNLLPLPILDGGMIILFVIEAIRRKPIHPKAAAAFQTVGVVIIFSLMVLAVFGDILYLAKR